jgi:hypothetical protein
MKLVNDASALLCITGDQKEQQSTQSKFSPAEYQKKDVLSKEVVLVRL